MSVSGRRRQRRQRRRRSQCGHEVYFPAERGNTFPGKRTKVDSAGTKSVLPDERRQRGHESVLPAGETKFPRKSKRRAVSERGHESVLPDGVHGHAPVEFLLHGRRATAVLHASGMGADSSGFEPRRPLGGT